MEGLWLLLHPSGTCGTVVFVRSLGPVTVINKAAVGAVIIIDSTQTIRMTSPCFVEVSSVATLSKTGPRAACKRKNNTD